MGVPEPDWQHQSRVRQMNRNGWKRLGVIVAAIALIASIVGSLAALAAGYGALRTQVQYNTEGRQEMRKDIKALLRGQARIEGKLEGDNE